MRYGRRAARASPRERRERDSAYSRGSTYWVPADADRTSLSIVERAALDIFDLHSKGASYIPSKNRAPSGGP